MAIFLILWLLVDKLPTKHKSGLNLILRGRYGFVKARRRAGMPAINVLIDNRRLSYQLD